MLQQPAVVKAQVDAGKGDEVPPPASRTAAAMHGRRCCCGWAAIPMLDPHAGHTALWHAAAGTSLARSRAAAEFRADKRGKRGSLRIGVVGPSPRCARGNDVAFEKCCVPTADVCSRTHVGRKHPRRLLPACRYSVRNRARCAERVGDTARSCGSGRPGADERSIRARSASKQLRNRDGAAAAAAARGLPLRVARAHCIELASAGKLTRLRARVASSSLRLRLHLVTGAKLVTRIIALAGVEDLPVVVGVAVGTTAMTVPSRLDVEAGSLPRRVARSTRWAMPLEACYCIVVVHATASCAGAVDAAGAAATEVSCIVSLKILPLPTSVRRLSGVMIVVRNRRGAGHAADATQNDLL